MTLINEQCPSYLKCMGSLRHHQESYNYSVLGISTEPSLLPSSQSPLFAVRAWLSQIDYEFTVRNTFDYCILILVSRMNQTNISANGHLVNTYWLPALSLSFLSLLSFLLLSLNYYRYCKPMAGLIYLIALLSALQRLTIRQTSKY